MRELSFILVSSEIDGEWPFGMVLTWLDEDYCSFLCFEVMIYAFKAALVNDTNWHIFDKECLRFVGIWGDWIQYEIVPDVTILSLLHFDSIQPDGVIHNIKHRVDIFEFGSQAQSHYIITIFHYLKAATFKVSMWHASSDSVALSRL